MKCLGRKPSRQVSNIHWVLRLGERLVCSEMVIPPVCQNIGLVGKNAEGQKMIWVSL